MILLVIPTYILNTEGSTFQKEHFVNYLAEFGKVDVIINHEKESPVNIEEIKKWKAESKINKVYLVNASYKTLSKETKEKISHNFRKHIEHLRPPDSNYPLWKSIVYDEYAGSLQGSEYKIEEALIESKPKLIFAPIPSVINSTLHDDLFFNKIIYNAKKLGITVVGFQYAPIIDKNFIHIYDAFDFYIVNSEADKYFLTAIGIKEEKVFTAQEKYVSLWSRTTHPQCYQYWYKGRQWREKLGIKDEEFLVGSAHIFSHRRELIDIIDTLIEDERIKFVINASKRINRRGFVDFEVAENYTLYRFSKFLGKRIFIVEESIIDIFYFSDALVLPADITYNILDIFKKPVIVYQKGLPIEYSFKNIVFTSSKQTVRDTINNYMKNHLSLKEIMNLLTKM